MAPLEAIVVAAVQTNPRLGDPAGNLAALLGALDAAAAAGAQLVVFPECQLSGYGFATFTAARAAAEPVPGPSTEVVARRCRALGVHVAFGLLERAGDRLYNTAAVVGPDGLVGRYRKTHLPRLGVDRFVAPGPGPLAVFETPVGRLGASICYDARFPEVHRTLALLGAEVILLLTCWPVGSEIVPEAFARVRASENRVFLVVASRVGVEAGIRFIGQSQILDPEGRILARAEAADDQIVLARIQPSRSRTKVVGAAAPLADLFGDRRPDLYGVLTALRVPLPQPAPE